MHAVCGLNTPGLPKPLQILVFDCVEYLSTNSDKLEAHVFPVPEEIDNQVGQMKLDSMGMTLDVLTKEQIKYLNSWNVGT